MSEDLNNHTGSEIHELVTNLTTLLADSIHLKREILGRHPPDIIKYFKDLDPGLNKKVLANFILKNRSHFKPYANLKKVRRFSDNSAKPSTERGLRGDLSVGVEPDDDGYDGRVSLFEELP